MPQMVPFQKNLFQLADIITEDELGIPADYNGDISSYISAFIQKFPKSKYCFFFKRSEREYDITITNNEVNFSFYSLREKSNRIFFHNSRFKDIYLEGFEEVLFENSNADEIQVNNILDYSFVNGTYNLSKIYDCDGVRLINASEYSLFTTTIDRCSEVEIISSTFNKLNVTNCEYVRIFSTNTITTYFSNIKELYLFSISSSETFIQNIFKLYFYALELLNSKISSVSEAYVYSKLEGQIQDSVVTFYSSTLENVLIKNSRINLAGVFEVKNTEIYNSDIVLEMETSFENTKIFSSTLSNRLLLSFISENFLINTKFANDIINLTYNGILFIDGLSYYVDSPTFSFSKIPFLPETITAEDGEVTVLEFLPRANGNIGINISEINLEGEATVRIYENETLIKTIQITSTSDIHDSVSVNKNKKIKITCSTTNTISAKFYINYGFETPTFSNLD